MSGLGVTLRSIAALCLFALAAGVQAATITIVNLDGPGEGFNDTTAVAPEGGNPGTTRGQQRLNLFQAAANVWATKLTSNQTIKVGANFDPLSPCSAAGGVLGSAGPTSVFKLTSPPAGYQANTWYAIAEAEAVESVNRNGTEHEIEAQFNSSVDSGCLGAGTRWWYGITAPTSSPSSQLNLFPVVLHELGHGLGFISLVCTQSAGCGAGAPQGALLAGSQDIWNFFLKNGSTGKLWKDMTSTERASSMVNNQHLVWSGANTTAAIPTYQPGRTGVDAATGLMKMYAPNPVEPGSSVSHWDTTASAPNLLMEPALQDEFNATDMTVPLFADIGWPMSAGAVNQAPTISVPVSIAVNEDTPSALTGISFADADAGTGSLTATFSVTAGALNAVSGAGVSAGGTATSRTLAGTLASLNAYIAGGNLSYTTALNAGGSSTLSVQVNDNGNTGSGGAKSASNTTNLAIAAINDAPTLNAPASIAVTEDTASTLSGFSFADVDAGAGNVLVTLSVGSGTLNALSSSGVTVGGSAASRTLTGSLVNVNAFISSGKLSFTPAANSTANVTLGLSVNDNGNVGSGGAKSASGNVTLTVAAVNDAPTLSASSSIAVTEDVATPLGGITFADPDAGSGSATANFVVATGSLSASSSAGITIGGTATNLTLVGTVANLNSYLAAGNLKYTTAADDSTSVALTASINDNGNSGSGGGKSATRGITLTVTAVNDAPSIAGPSGLSVAAPGSTPVSGLSLGDSDAGAASMTLTLNVGAGTLSAPTSGGVTATGSGTANATLTGSLANLNAYLAANNVAFVASGALPGGTATLTATINDNGSSGGGGAKTASKSIVLDASLLFRNDFE